MCDGRRLTAVRKWRLWLSVRLCHLLIVLCLLSLLLAVLISHLLLVMSLTVGLVVWLRLMDWNGVGLLIWRLLTLVVRLLVVWRRRMILLGRWHLLMSWNSIRMIVLWNLIGMWDLVL